jgi:hypothetical protein
MSLDWKPVKGGPPRWLLLWIRVAGYLVFGGLAVYCLFVGNTLGLIACTLLALATDVHRTGTRLYQFGRTSMEQIVKQMDDEG